MGCCGTSEKVGFDEGKHFQKLEENIDQNIICRPYPYPMLASNANQAPEDIKTYRLVLMGDKQVGKTQIVEALQKRSFLEEYEATIEQEVMVMHKVPLSDNDHSGLLTHDVNDFYDCLLKVMDTAGMNDTLSMNINNDVSVTDSTKLREWIIKGHVFIIVFDLTNKESFQDIPSFLDEIAKCKQIDNPPIILVGNKCDLVFNDHNKEQYGIKSDDQDEDDDKTDITVINNHDDNGKDDKDKTDSDKDADENDSKAETIPLTTTDALETTGEHKSNNDSTISTSYIDGAGGVNHTSNESESIAASNFTNLTTVEHSEDKDERQVTRDEIYDLCIEWDMPYVQCSAKTNYNINSIFNIAIKESLMYQSVHGTNMRKWMRIKRTMSLENNDTLSSLHN